MRVTATSIERSCGLLASLLSEGRRKEARLVSGDRRGFGLNVSRTIVDVPYPALADDWSLRTWTCGVALQCAPSKDRIARYVVQDLDARQRRALILAEAEVALAWVSSRLPGLMPELRRHLPDLDPTDAACDAPAIFARAWELAHSRAALGVPPLLGGLPSGSVTHASLLTSIRKMYGRMPWSERRRKLSPGFDTVPVGGDAAVQNPNLPPPSRPEEDDAELRVDRRIGIPYPEWNLWTARFTPDHVAVLERKHVFHSSVKRPPGVNLRRWFEQHTHRVLRNRLEDGSDLDVDSYIAQHVDRLAGKEPDGRVFRELLPSARDVTTALLLDGSASLGGHRGRIFQLELACADALCQAMTLARERHGLFVFNGQTRHRVDVTCLRDFRDACGVLPSELGLRTSGYTRLGAPLRHLTSRLLTQPSQRRLMIVIGDGMISDDGYEGQYAWADTAHAVEEAEAAGIIIYYIGVGQTRVDPLPDVFGKRRFTRIQRVEELPHVLARVHRALVAA